MFTAALIAIVALTLIFQGIFVHARVYPDGRCNRALSTASETQVWDEFWDAYDQFGSRMIPTLALTIVVMMQVIIASEVFTEAEAEELTTLFDLGVIAIGPFTIVAYLMLIWMLAPFAGFVLTVLRSEDLQTELGFGDSDLAE